MERRRGPRMAGPMQEAFAKANILVVKEKPTSLGVSEGNSPLTDRRVGNDPNAEFSRRQDDILKDQIAFAQRQLELEQKDPSHNHQESQMETNGTQPRVHRITRTTVTEEPKKGLTSISRRIWELMDDFTKKGEVQSVSAIAKIMKEEGYKFESVVVQFNSLIRGRRHFEIPAGYTTAKPAVYLLKKDAPEIPQGKPYRTIKAESAPVEKPVAPLPTVSAAPAPVAAPVMTPVEVPTTEPIKTAPQEQVDPKRALKEALEGVRNLDGKEISEILLDSLNTKQTMAVYHSIRLLIGM